MNVIRLMRLTAISLTLLGAGSVRAEDLTSPVEALPREQLQDRMRNMTPEEQRIMRETRSDRRDQLESKQSTQGSGMRQGGGGRGKGGGRNHAGYAGVTP